MAEYHVGAGLFGNIYAGTLIKIDKKGMQIWRNRSDVTYEAINAVMEHFRTEMALKEKYKINAEYDFANGQTLKASFELVDKEGINDPHMDT